MSQRPKPPKREPVPPTEGEAVPERGAKGSGDLSEGDKQELETAIAKSKPRERPLTEMQDRFCQEYVARDNGAESYLAAGYDVSKQAAISNASKLLMQPRVKKRIADIKAAHKRRATIKRDELIEFLADVVRTPITDVMATVKIDPKTGEYAGPVSPLLQSIKPTMHGPSYEMPNKMDALKELNRMLGHYEPEKVEIGIEQDLKSMLTRLTGQSREERQAVPTYDAESTTTNDDDND